MQTFVEVARGVAFMRCALVNVAAVGDGEGWALIDSRIPGHAPATRRQSRRLSV